MKKEFERFDMKAPPIRTPWFFLPIMITAASWVVLTHKGKIRKVNTKELKPPFLLLCNHNAFNDFAWQK